MSIRRSVLVLLALALASGSASRAKAEGTPARVRAQHVRKLIADSQARIQEFRVQLDAALERGVAVAGDEHVLSSESRRLKTTMARAASDFDERQDVADIREHVASAVAAADAIDGARKSVRLSRGGVEIWRALRRDLAALAEICEPPAGES